MNLPSCRAYPASNPSIAEVSTLLLASDPDLSQQTESQSFWPVLRRDSKWRQNRCSVQAVSLPASLTHTWSNFGIHVLSTWQASTAWLEDNVGMDFHEHASCSPDALHISNCPIDCWMDCHPNDAQAMHVQSEAALEKQKPPGDGQKNPCLKPWLCNTQSLSVTHRTPHLLCYKLVHENSPANIPFQDPTCWIVQWIGTDVKSNSQQNTW